MIEGSCAVENLLKGREAIRIDGCSDVASRDLEHAIGFQSCAVRPRGPERVTHVGDGEDSRADLVRPSAFRPRW